MQRVRLLREEPHSQKAAEEAIGLRTDNGRRTKDVVEGMDEDSVPAEEQQSDAKAIQ